jgi:thymidine kinase
VPQAKAGTVVKLTDRVRVITNVPGNVVVLSTGDGVVLVDSGSTALAATVPKALGRDKDQKLFNTHYHADQTGGNALFATAGAEIHAHAITKQWLAADYYVPAEDRWVKAPAKEAIPKVTFRNKGEIKAGAETVQFGYLLEAHTRGDAYVFFRDSNVLVACDVSSPQRDPVLDWYAGGWLGGRADAMDDLVELVNDQTLVVPAYGPVMTAAELMAQIEADTQVVGIDEGQLFDMEIIEAANELARSGKRVIVAGLDQDYMGRPFEPMPQLLSVAEFITKTHAICVKCGNTANYSQRTSESTERVEVGASDKYEARCRKCFVPHSDKPTVN